MTPDPLIVAIETHRRRQGVTVANLCRAAHMNPGTWYRIMQRGSATLPTLHAFARALGLAYTLVPLHTSPSHAAFLAHVTTEDLLAELARRLAVTPPAPSTTSSTEERAQALEEVA